MDKLIIDVCAKYIRIDVRIFLTRTELFSQTRVNSAVDSPLEFRVSMSSRENNSNGGKRLYVTGCRFDNRQGWPEYHQTEKSGKPLLLPFPSFPFPAPRSRFPLSFVHVFEGQARETEEAE